MAGIDLTPSKQKRLATDFKSTPSRRTPEVTPDVAATTAAALNAERTAQRLKSALLRVRKEPLLNKQAENAPVPPSILDFVLKPEPVTPQKEFTLSSSMFNSLNLVDLPKTPQWSMPLFDIPETPSDGSPSHGGVGPSRRSKMHEKAPVLKKSPNAAAGTSPPPSGFSWGPLPGITPMKTLSSDLRKKEEEERTSNKLPFSLSNSWVTDDFDTKK